MSGVAVVTVVAGRHEHLRHHLALLAQQDLAHHHVVVAVDDAEAAALARGAGATVLEAPRHHGHLPIAAARNAGVRAGLAAGADVLVLLDVDCLAGPGLLTAYAKACRRDPGTVWSGPVTYLTAHQRPYPTRADRLVALDAPHPGRPAPAPGDEVDEVRWELFWSLSAALHRDAWARTGGFDEAYVGYGGEDTDLGRRAERAGLRLRWLGSARAFHQHHRVESPPVGHLHDLLRNGALFAERWGDWPFAGWFAAFERRGLVVRDGRGGWAPAAPAGAGGRPDLPRHLLLGPPAHGVHHFGRLVAEAAGAPTTTDPAELDGLDGPDGPGDADGPPRRVHLHLTDRLLARDPAAAAARVEAWAGRCALTVTLHDVPQPTDGAAYDARRAAYARIVAAVDGWVVSSEHERALVRDLLPAGGGHDEGAGAVVPLPLEPFPRTPLPPPPDLPAGDTVALFGWLYPGKGHAEVLRALAGVPRRRPVTVVSLGGVAEGHDHLVGELEELAAACGVGLRLTGWLDEAVALAWLQHATVPVAGHRNVSASGSVNSWVAAGRRPLVRRSRYAEEVERLRPGSHLLWRDEELPARLAAALADPASTHLPEGPPPGPSLESVAAAYVAWWRRHERPPAARAGAA